MECYQGERITVRSRATNPVTLKLVTDATATALLFNPNLDPIHVPADRAVADYLAVMTFDDVSRYYLAQVDTSALTAGEWTVQAKVVGGEDDADSWQWFTLNVLA